MTMTSDGRFDDDTIEAMAEHGTDETVVRLARDVRDLRRWRREATTVIARWDQVYAELGHPGRIGDMASEAALQAVKRLNDRLDGLTNIADGSWVTAEHIEMIRDSAKLHRKAALRVSELEMKVARLQRIGDTLAGHADLTDWRAAEAVSEWEQQ